MSSGMTTPRRKKVLRSEYHTGIIFVFVREYVALMFRRDHPTSVEPRHHAACRFTIYFLFSVLTISRRDAASARMNMNGC